MAKGGAPDAGGAGQYKGLRPGGFHDHMNSKHDEHMGVNTCIVVLGVVNLLLTLLVGAGVLWLIHQQQVAKCPACSESVAGRTR
mmetsp:Transcript_18388/g.50603  ORF Transcript_18388/g.50603 Transcript_18388/m.50603 type:complete len:84 (+) Transcript_18388:51-302(+)